MPDWSEIKKILQYMIFFYRGSNNISEYFAVWEWYYLVLMPIYVNESSLSADVNISNIDLHPMYQCYMLSMELVWF